MAIPDFQSIMLPLLQLASDGQDRKSRDAVTALAGYFSLTEKELAELVPSGQDYLFANRWGWARTYLKKAGLLEYPSRGLFRITSAGKSLLAENPPAINIALLKRYPEFNEFWNGPLDSGSKQTASAEAAVQASGETPEELLSSAHEKLRKQVQSELLAKVRNCSPAYFERLVVRLLIAMGYGGSIADAGSAIGQSGDGGVDGEIKEDKLGLDRIYIQAKRWGNANVGSSEVRDFVGALAGKRSRKGVLITTSGFSNDAKVYVTRLVEKSVILVDGERLTELMFDYGLGVVTESTYHVKRVEADFFDEEG